MIEYHETGIEQNPLMRFRLGIATLETDLISMHKTCECFC